jgi:hypothetical protein
MLANSFLQQTEITVLIVAQMFCPWGFGEVAKIG